MRDRLIVGEHIPPLLFQFAAANARLWPYRSRMSDATNYDNCRLGIDQEVINKTAATTGNGGKKKGAYKLCRLRL